jgi:Ca-activated chloride channel family protein
VQGAIGDLRDKRWLRTRGLLWLLLSSPSLAMSQGQSPNTAPSRDTYPSPASILVHSDLVLIPVTVTDHGGSIVTGLRKEDFTLFEDEVQQVITHFGSEDAPASIGFVFDTSGSMRPKLHKAREAVAALLNEANSEDEFFLVQFSTAPQLVVPMTRRREDIWKGVETLQVIGATALLDAVTLAMEEMKHASHTRKAIIIISDGEDNSSHCSMNQFKAAVREGDVLIYAIGIDSGNSDSNSRMQDVSGSAFLREITKQSGGRLIEIQKLKQLPEAASRIGEWLHRQYVLGYAPNNSAHNGGYHRIQLKLSKPKGFPRLYAFWRLGYYEPAE